MAYALVTEGLDMEQRAKFDEWLNYGAPGDGDVDDSVEKARRRLFASQHGGR